MGVNGTPRIPGASIGVNGARRMRRRRVPLLALALVALFARAAHRLGCPVMALGFLGTLVSLERAVALGRWWSYAAPLAAGLGALAALAGAPGGLGPALLTLAGLVLLAAHLVLQRMAPSAHNAVMGLGALAWSAAAVARV